MNHWSDACEILYEVHHKHICDPGMNYFARVNNYKHGDGAKRRCYIGLI